MEYMENIFNYVLKEKGGGTFSRKLLIISLLDIDLINNANRSITTPHPPPPLEIFTVYAKYIPRVAKFLAKYISPPFRSNLAERRQPTSFCKF